MFIPCWVWGKADEVLLPTEARGTQNCCWNFGTSDARSVTSKFCTGSKNKRVRPAVTQSKHACSRLKKWHLCNKILCKQPSFSIMLALDRLAECDLQGKNSLGILPHSSELNLVHKEDRQRDTFVLQLSYHNSMVGHNFYFKLSQLLIWQRVAEPAHN